MASGNSIDSKSYSDGKIVGPMLSTFPVISICSKCNAIFWFNKIKEVDRYEFMSENWEKWIGVETARFLSIQEYFTALETQLAETTEEEFFIRKNICWAFNDRFTGGRMTLVFYDSKKNNEFLHDKDTAQTLYLENIKRMLDLIDPTNVNRLLLRAELNRNLGNFEECLFIIHRIDNPDLSKIKAAIKNECENKNATVFQIL
jgi:hypothetical protein